MLSSPKDNAAPAWEPMPGESNLWYDRFARFLAQGATRSVRAVYQEEKGNEHSKSVPASWTEASHRYDWPRRAQAYDAFQRRRIFSSGNAQDTERIKKLDALAERMHARLESSLDTLEVNEKFIAQYLAVLDLLAKHTGGYAPQRHELTGKDGGKIEIEEEQTMRVVFYVPEVASAEQPELITEGESEPT